MSAGQVDVLAVMRRLSDLALNSGGRRGEDEDDNEPAIELWERSEEARAAVAELIEAGNEALRARDAFAANPTRETGRAANAADERLRAALARVGGGH